MKIVLNLYGGPGTGKSTTASGVFTLMKLHGVTCELITEFAKDLTWEERSKTLQNQTYILGKQHHRLWRIPEDVELVITDSPILQGSVYTDDELTKAFIMEKSFEFNNIDFFLKRVKPYNPIGRNQTEEQAKELDKKIKLLLNNFILDYKIITADYSGINQIVSYMLNKMRKGNQEYFLRKGERNRVI